MEEKNKKGSAGIITAVVIILAVIVLVLLWLFVFKDQSTKDIVYSNTDYGFDVSLPSDWDQADYRFVSRAKSGDPDFAVVDGVIDYIDLECKQKDNSFVSIAVIDVYDRKVYPTLTDLNQYLEQPGMGTNIVGENTKYYFGYGLGQVTPDDCVITSELFSGDGTKLMAELEDILETGFKAN